MITAAGAGSGIDIESIITQLMNLEQRPITALESKQSELDVELSDIGKLRSALSDLGTVAEKLTDIDQFGAWDIESTDEDVVKITEAQGRVAENHDIEITSLASAHRLLSAAYVSETSDLTPGVFEFSSGDETFSVTLSAGQSSLIDLRDALNNSSDNTTVQASILNTNSGSQLVLTATSPGTENVITAPPEFTELNAATDAELTIDGLAVTSSSNVLTSVVPGLTIELQSAGSASMVSTRNIDSIKELFEEFASSYNSLRDTITSLNQGSLQGDSLLRHVESSLRNEFFEPVDLGDGNTGNIFEFGLTFDKTGVLSVDDEKINEAIAANVNRIINAFTVDDTGFGERVNEALEQYTDVGGFFDNREDAIDARNNSIDRQITRLEDRMDQIETRYRRQFGSMDSTISQLQSSGNFLLQTLSSNE